MGIFVDCVCPSVCLSVRLFVSKHHFLCMITRHRFELESPNLHQTYIIWYFRLDSKMTVIDLDYKVIWVILTKNYREFGCPLNNASQIWAGIIKFPPNGYPGILSTGFENEGHWRRPSRSLWPFWLRILGNSACPWNNSPQTPAEITKFSSNMHPEILWASI